MTDEQHTPEFVRPGPGVPMAPPPAGAPVYPRDAGRPLAGATAFGAPRPRRRRTALAAGVGGALTALAVLAGTAGIGPALSAVTAPAAPTAAPAATAPAATAPAVPGVPATQPATHPAAAPATTRPATQARQGETRAASEAQSRGVVLITTRTNGGAGAGTGMVIDAGGLILTNYHVVQGSTAVRVTLASTGQDYAATVVGHDAVTDVALLRIDATGLPTVTLDADPVAVGDAVSAVGNAQGQNFLSAAPGRITDTDQTVTVTNDSASRQETLTGVYVADAAAQPGDSGGPLFDAQNEVTAMTTAGQQTYAGPRTRTTSPTTVEMYAIPIAKAMAVVGQIRAGAETGQVRIGPNAYLGIMVTPGQAAGGVVVSDVTPGTPAAKAGLTAGSTITAVGGEAIATQAQLAAALGVHNPGDAIKVAWTDPAGQTRTASVTLAESPVN